MSDLSGITITKLPLPDISCNEVPVYPRPKIPVILIAMLGSVERAENIATLINKFNPIIQRAITNNSPHRGNCLSHLQVAKTAKLLFPDLPYLVLEDDAFVVDENFWTLIDEHKDVDLLYFGYNNSCSHYKPIPTEYVWGTHCLLVSPKARDAIINHFEEVSNMEFWTQEIGFDSMLTVIAHKAGLTSWKPAKQDRYKYICQKEGFTSFLSGHKRRNNL